MRARSWIGLLVCWRLDRGEKFFFQGFEATVRVEGIEGKLVLSRLTIVGRWEFHTP